MYDKLFQSLLTFTGITRSALSKLRQDMADYQLGKSLSQATLPFSIEELESQNEFHKLTTETRYAFASYHRNNISEEIWQEAIHNLLCQSYYYLKMIEGENINLDYIFPQYCSAFKKHDVQTIYLAPLEFVSFTQSYMDFGAFKIKRFSFEELDTILRNKVNKLFYNWAAFSPKDLKLLSQYWFIDTTGSASAPELGTIYLPSSTSGTLIFGGYAEQEFTHFPKLIEAALQQLCLFDWAVCERKPKSPKIISRKDDWKDPWLKFSVPFVLEISDNPLVPPQIVPALSGLSVESKPNHSTGEEIDEPEIHVQLDESKTKQFIEFTQHISYILQSLEADKDGNEWSFLETALGYFVKAFLTEPNLEQLLWHITALEALIGEEGDGTTEKLAKRLGFILGKDKNDRNNIARRFRNLYEVRSSLVHGKSQSKADVTALIDAYRFSRLAILWFLHYLRQIQSRLEKGDVCEGTPKRKEILMSLDIDKNIRHRLKWLLDGVSEKFPYINEWIE